MQISTSKSPFSSVNVFTNILAHIDCVVNFVDTFHTLYVCVCVCVSLFACLFQSVKFCNNVESNYSLNLYSPGYFKTAWPGALEKKKYFFGWARSTQGQRSMNVVQLCYFYLVNVISGVLLGGCLSHLAKGYLIMSR